MHVSQVIIIIYKSETETDLKCSKKGDTPKNFDIYRYTDTHDIEF